jgi:hypothetical protein
VFNRQLTANLPKYLPPKAVEQIHGSTVTASPAQLNALPAPIRHGFIQAFDNSLHTVFLAGVPIGLAAFVLSWFLRELPLREKAYVSAAEAAGAADGAGAADPPPDASPS